MSADLEAPQEAVRTPTIISTTFNSLHPVNHRISVVGRRLDQNRALHLHLRRHRHHYLHRHLRLLIQLSQLSVKSLVVEETPVLLSETTLSKSSTAVRFPLTWMAGP